MTDEVIPFGKYRGQPVAVLQHDRGYLDWLTAQPWFRERYGGLFQIIVNNFAEPSETPEHNRLQARFLDPAFCYRVANRLLDFAAILQGLLSKEAEELASAEAAAEQARDKLVQECKKNSPIDETLSPDAILAGLDRLIADIANWAIKSARDELARRESRVATIAAAVEQFEAYLFTIRTDKPTADLQIATEFEVSGWDVQLRATLGPGPRDRNHDWRLIFDRTLLIELKPTLGDDYPAVLRQMKANRTGANARALIIGECTAAGASLAQITAIFAASDFTLLELSEFAG